MSANTYQYEWSTDPTSQFRGAIAQNAGVDLDLAMSGSATPSNPSALAGVNGDTKGIIRSLTIVSVENLAWEVVFWESTNHGTVVAGTVKMIGKWSFLATDAFRIGGTGDYYYYIEDLDIPLQDADKSGKLHITLVNRSVASKSAGDAGAIVIKGRISQPIY